jgi:hypothetical protein
MRPGISGLVSGDVVSEKARLQAFLGKDPASLVLDLHSAAALRRGIAKEVTSNCSPMLRITWPTRKAVLGLLQAARR